MIFSKLLKSQGSAFWILHLAVWTVWGSYKYFYTTGILGEHPPHYYFYVPLITLIAMVLTLGLRYIYRAVIQRPIWIQLFTFLAGSASAAWVWLYCRTYIFTNFIMVDVKYGEWMEESGELSRLYEAVSYMETFNSSWWIIGAWSVLYFAMKYRTVFQEVRESALKSAAMAHEAQLKMLRYQLNPHFLFNTLNAISTLVLEKNTELANRMVTKLSSFLRFSLDNDPMQKITLEQELEAIGLYLDIEKVRFEERLRLEQDIEQGARQALIPSLLLQPLVENAIKYGIARAEEGSRLRIAARVFAGDLLLEVSDDGPGAELVDGHIPSANGVGLKNTRERLRELYGSQHSFKLSNTEPHGLTVNIRIPFES